jgi:hypothetical protein
VGFVYGLEMPVHGGGGQTSQEDIHLIALLVYGGGTFLNQVAQNAETRCCDFLWKKRYVTDPFPLEIS